MGERQRGSAAHVRTGREPIRHEKGMRCALSPRRRQRVETAPKLLNPATARPPRELAADAVGVARSGKQQTRIEHRLLANNGYQFLKFHGNNVLDLSICCNDASIVWGVLAICVSNPRGRVGVWKWGNGH